MNIDAEKSWRAKGKVRIVPFMGGVIAAVKKSPLIGEWKYDCGVLRRTALFGLKEFDLRKEVELVEISSSRILTDHHAAKEINPSNLTAWAMNPLVGQLYEAAKRNQLSRKPLITIYTNSGGVADMYVDQAILQELVTNFEVRSSD